MWMALLWQRFTVVNVCGENFLHAQGSDAMGQW